MFKDLLNNVNNTNMMLGLNSLEKRKKAKS